MQSVSSDFLQLVKGSTNPVYTADVWYDGQLVYENVRLVDSSVQFDAAQGVRSTVDLVIADPDNVLVPTSQASPLAPFGGVVNIRAGFTWNGQTETVSLGWYDIQQTDIDEAFKTYTLQDGTTKRAPAGAVITITGADFMQRVIDYKFLSPDVAVVNATTNLVTNPGLDFNDEGWSADFGTTGGGKFTRVTKRAFKGGVSGQMLWDNASTNSATGGIKYAQAGLAAATTYTFSMVVKSSKAVTMAAKIEWQNSAGGVISTSSGSDVTLKANTWTRLTVTATSPALTSQASLNVMKTVASIWAKGQYLLADNARLIVASAPDTWTVWDEIKRLVSDVVDTFEPDFDTPEVPAGIVYDSDRFDAVLNLAKLANAEPVMTPDGQLTLKQLSDGDLAPDIDFKVNLTSYKRSLTRDNVFNIVVASGKNSKSLTIRRTATTSSGALAVDGPFGRKPTFYDSDLLNTTQAVQSKAQDLLDDVATARNQQIPVTILPNPAIELNDFVNLVTDTQTIQGRITSFTYRAVGEMDVTVSVPNFWWVS